MLKLIDLPTEILCSIPQFIRNIEDFNNAASSCRTLHLAFSNAKPNAVLKLADGSAPTFFSPHPYFLVMATAPQVSDWAIGCEERTQELEQAFRGGIDGLYDLSLRVAGLTMADIRRLHLARFDIINPLVNKLDQMAGVQWYSSEKSFWDGGVSEACTIQLEPQRTAFQLIIYWELFGSTLHAFLQPELRLPRFSLHTRLEYVKYCIPDWVCRNGYPGLEVLPVGPYAHGTDDTLDGDQIALQHILECSRWERLWDKPRHEAGPDFKLPWRQILWLNAMQSFGLASMEIIKNVKVTSTVDPRFPPDNQARTVLSEDWRHKLVDIRGQIEMLDDNFRPRTQHINDNLELSLTDAPNLAVEVHACMARYWRNL